MLPRQWFGAIERRRLVNAGAIRIAAYLDGLDGDPGKVRVREGLSITGTYSATMARSSGTAASDRAARG